MANVIKTDELVELLKQSGINIPRSAVSTYAKRYGINKADSLEKIYYDKRSPGGEGRKVIIKTGIYEKPTTTKLNQIKEQFDINRLKAPGTTEEGAKAFTKRESEARKLLSTGKYTVPEVSKIMEEKFGTSMVTTLGKISRELGNVPSGRGEEGTVVSRVKDDLNKLYKSDITKSIKGGDYNVDSLIKRTAKNLGVDEFLASRRLGQLVEAFKGDNSYIKAENELLAEKSNKIIKGISSGYYGGLGGNLQRKTAERKVAEQIGEGRNFFSNLKKRIQELIPSNNIEIDVVKNLASSARLGTGPYSIFLQGIRSDINQDKMSELDKVARSYESKIQNTDNLAEKKEIAKEYNDKAKNFVKEVNKDLKPGQPPVRVLEFSFESPEKVIKNKYALENYGDLYNDIYKKHGYSFKVPADLKTVSEVKPYLESGKGGIKTAKLLAARAPRIFGIPAAAYLGYQALDQGTAEAKTPSPIQDTQTAMQDQAVEGQVPEQKLASPIKYDQYAGFVTPENPNQKASQSDLLYWIADNEIPEEVQQVGKIVGEAAAVIGGATVGLGLPDVKKTIEEARIAGKSPVKGVLGKGFYRLGSPFATAAFTIPQALDEKVTATEMATDPLNYLGLATMETLGKRAGTIAAPAAAEATGIMGALKNYATLKNVGEAIPGKLSAALRLGLNPRVIAGASRFLGIPGLIASTGYSLYDYLSNKDKETQ
jgi:hypothetical protein